MDEFWCEPANKTKVYSLFATGYRQLEADLRGQRELSDPEGLRFGC